MTEQEKTELKEKLRKTFYKKVNKEKEQLWFVPEEFEVNSFHKLFGKETDPETFISICQTIYKSAKEQKANIAIRKGRYDGKWGERLPANSFCLTRIETNDEVEKRIEERFQLELKYKIRDIQYDEQLQKEKQRKEELLSKLSDDDLDLLGARSRKRLMRN